MSHDTPHTLHDVIWMIFKHDEVFADEIMARHSVDAYTVYAKYFVLRSIYEV